MLKKISTFFVASSFLFLTSGKLINEVNSSFTPIKQFEIYDGGTKPLKYKAVIIHTDKAKATSFLVEGSTKYLPNNAIDGNLSTAWVESVKGNGIGEKITIYLDRAPEGLAIMPGFAKSEELWNKNNRVAGFIIRFLKMEEGKIDYMITEPISVKLLKENGIVPFKKQYVDFSGLWTQNMESCDIAGIEIEITDVDSKNAIYNDTCISEIELYGTGQYIEN